MISVHDKHEDEVKIKYRREFVSRYAKFVYYNDNRNQWSNCNLRKIHLPLALEALDNWANMASSWNVSDDRFSVIYKLKPSVCTFCAYTVIDSSLELGSLVSSNNYIRTLVRPVHHRSIVFLINERFSSSIWQAHALCNHVGFLFPRKALQIP